MTLKRSTVTWRGAKANEAVKRGAYRGLQLSGENVLEKSNRVVPISPVGTESSGTLLRSGVADVDRVRGVGVVYYDTPYAVRQHEELDYQHDAGRTAKFLENTINDPLVKEQHNTLLAREIKRELGG